MFETLGFTLSQLELWLLIFIRFFTLLSVLPFFSYDTFNPRLRGLLAILLATITVKTVPFPESNFPVGFTILMFYALREVFVGLCIGTFCGIFTEIVKYAGNLVSQMMGLSMASMIDPTTSQESEVMPEIFNIFAILLILAANGHHFFIRAMFDTLYMIPVTEASYPFAEISQQLISLVSSIIVLGIRVSAPMMIIVFLIRIVVGILNRLIQDADIFAVILIIDILVGLYILMYYWPYYAQIVNLVFNFTQAQVLTIIRLMGVIS